MAGLTGKTIKGYELRDPLGSGSFGEVYHAHQSSVGREVAIKIILSHYANNPDFIRRFEAEAQMVARVEHPFIVPLYDYWRDAEGAFLVMRFLRGGSLKETLKQGRMNMEDITRFLEQICGALQAAHQNGVVHRDLKPANILRDDAGNYYLADFGIAKDLRANVRSSEVVGSPAYLSPEQVRAEEVDTSADIYSLGLLIYECLAGERPFLSTSLTELMMQQMNDPVPDLTLKRPDLSPEMNHIVQRATAKNPKNRYKSALQVLAAFRRATLKSYGGDDDKTQELPMVNFDPAEETTREFSSSLNVIIPEPENPYKGLRAFQETDEADFFGRETLEDELLARLDAQAPFGRFLAVVGPSGSGKSSVVRAGLLPRLRHGALPGSDKWFYVDMMPGAQPYNELAAALLKVAIDPPKNLMAALRADTGHLGQAIRDLIPQDGQFVLFIDQFEELFTQVEDEAERLAFLESLLKALEDPQGQLWVILTLRADFYDRPLYYKAFGEALRQRTEVILPLSTEELHDSIEKPAERAGLELEHGLASMIVGEVMEQPGGLPLLQYALTELFNRRENRNLSLKAFREMGGVSGALARRAETLYEAAPPAQQDLIRQIFIRLVTLGEGTEDTRRRIALKELYSLGLEKAKVDEVLGTFGQYRLLTFDHDPLSREPNLELAHEALIRQWQTLRAWISDLRDDLRQQARLASIAQEWERAGRDPSYLANGAQLDQFQAWAGQTSILLNTREQAFLQASTQKEADREAREQAQAAREKALEDRSRRFLRALVAVLALALLGALGLILTTLQARDEAEAAQAKAESQQSIAQSLALVAEARNALSAGEPNTALGLSLAAANLTSPPLADAELLLSQSAYGPGLRYQMGGHTASLVAVTFSPDGRYALTASVDQTAILWDLSTGQEVSRLSGGHNGPVTAVAFSPDGRLAATGSFDKTTLIWDLSSGGVRHILTHEDQVNAIAFSPDGRYLATAAGNARQVERDTAARLWEVESGRLIRSYIHIGAVQALAFSPDGRYLVTTSGGVDTNNQSVDRRGRLWEVETGRLITRYEGFTGGIRDVDFNSDGSRLVFGTWDVANSGTIRVFDTQSAEEIERIFAHPNVVTRVRFSPDDSLIFSASWDSSVRIWDAVRGLEVRKFTAHTDRVLAMDISPDGQFLLTGTGNLGDNFEVERGRDLQARLWDLQPRAEVTRYMGHEDWVWSVAYHPTEDLMASSSGHFLEPEGDHSIRFWRASTGEELRVLQGHNFTVDHVTFSRDGQWLASSDWGGVVWLWEAPSGVATRQLSGLIDRAYSVDFHPDGRRLIGGSAGKMIIEWDISTGLEIRRWENLEGGIYSVKYSPDGRSFLSSDTDGRIILWDTESGAEIRRFVGHANRVDRAIFSPDGSLILSVSSRDGTARLWETATGQELRQLRGHIGGVTDGVFDSTGKWIVTGGPDKTVRVWLTETGQEIRRFEGHTDWVVSVDISPDGQFILSGSDDLSVRQWQFARDVAALEAWARVNRHIPPLACSDIQPLGLELECE